MGKGKELSLWAMGEGKVLLYWASVEPALFFTDQMFTKKKILKFKK